jgi:hypothetical protein
MKRTTAPGKGAAGSGRDDSLSTPEAIPLQLRRRREASQRVPPLEDRRRDPLEVPPVICQEPLRIFWSELRARRLVTPAITAELVRLDKRGWRND